MKVLLLAAGYATRLYPLTLDKPKPLLPIGGKPVIQFIVDLIEPLKEIDEIFIVTNQKFHENFKNWKNGAESSKKIVIVNDHTLSNEDRLGATGDIEFVIREKNIKEDLLVLAGDNVFKSGLKPFVDFSLSKKPSVCVGLYDVKDPDLARKYGIVVIDENKRIIEFREKPSRPNSTLAAECLYFFSKEKLNVFREYLSTDTAKDAPGYFLEWLSAREPVFGYVFESEKWFDIGDKKSYDEANREFGKEI
jgi:glucose-1-phosphate thymidylyltransferase